MVNRRLLKGTVLTRTVAVRGPPLVETVTDDTSHAAPVLGRPLIRRDVVSSTMDELRALARAGAPEGTTLVAEYQSAGRGRAGRGWQAPSGTSLLLSVLLRPHLAPSELTPLALLTAACVADAVEAITGLRPRIKWPNDLLIGDHKVCGILASVSAASSGPPVLILGVGLNVNIEAKDLPLGAASVSIELGRAVDRTKLLDALLERLSAMYGSFLNRAFDAWWRRATERLAYVGERVVVEDNDRALHGVLTGVAAGGELCLLGEDGRIRQIVAGELVRGPRIVP